MVAINKLYKDVKAHYVNFGKGQRGGSSTKTKYALLSDIAYKKGIKARRDTLAAYDKSGKWTIDAALSNRDVVVFKSTKTGEVVVAVRGTDPISKDTRWRDLSTDIGITLGVSRFGKRNAEVSSVVKAAAEKYDTTPTLTGHSLGGRVAADIARSQDLKAVVFNQGSSPTDWVPAMARRLGVLSERGGDVESYHQTNDLVSLSSRVSKPDEAKVEGDAAAADAHFLKNFLKEGDQVGDGMSGGDAKKWIAKAKRYRATHPGMSYKDSLIANSAKTKATTKGTDTPWIAHVRATRAKHKCTFREAMVLASKTYKRAAPKQ